MNNYIGKITPKEILVQMNVQGFLLLDNYILQINY